MTPQPNRTSPSRAAPPAPPPRLQITRTAHNTTSVDGAWWPRSDILTTELPELLAALTPRIGPTHRVIYHLGEWAAAPIKFTTGGRRVRLDGYRHKPAHTIDVLGIDGTEIALLIIPPRTPTATARTAMATAIDPTVASTVAELITIATQDDLHTTEAVAAEQQWESEGGSERAEAASAQRIGV